MSRLVEIALAWPRLTALALGLLSALGFEPLALWPLTLLALAGLIMLLRRAPGRGSAFALGWAFGFGQFALSLNWIVTAFSYQAAMPAWLGWIAELGLSACLAVYPALAAFAAWHLRARLLAMLPAFASAWIVLEWLRGWLFTGFPWNPLGAVLLGPFEQVGAARLLPWLGTYALSGLAVLLAALWYLGLAKYRTDRRMLALLMVPIVLQFWPSFAPERPPLSKISYALVQPYIPQEQLNDPAYYEANFVRLSGGLPPPQSGLKALVLWPESGLSDYLRDGYPGYFYSETHGGDPALARARIARMLGPDRLLLSGAVDLELRGGRVAGARNAITAIDGTGTIRASYAKAHLVPFGEYVPMKGLLDQLGISRFVPGNVEFWPGPGQQTIDLGAAYGKAGMLVCYEIIFPGAATDPRQRPDYLFNPSNDGWYGSWGQPQFLALARMRAIEEGLPVLRSTTTGISAVIGPDGGVLQSVPYRAAGVLMGRVPKAHAPTLFARTGNLLSLGWAFILLVLSLVALRARPV